MSLEQGPTSVRVQILGEEHVVKGHASNEYIKSLAELVSARGEEIQNNNPMLPRYQVAILVAINLANELKQLEKDHQELLALLEEAN